MAPLSKFNPKYYTSSSSATSSSSHPNRASYDSQSSRSSQDSHISSMSTASEDFAFTHDLNHNPQPIHTNTHKRNTSNISTDSTSPPNIHKALPESPARPAPRAARRSIAFASSTSDKPLPETPKHPHLSKVRDMSRRQKVKRTSSRESGYVWYAQNCRRIRDQCEADGVCDLDRSSTHMKN